MKIFWWGLFLGGAALLLAGLIAFAGETYGMANGKYFKELLRHLGKQCVLPAVMLATFHVARIRGYSFRKDLPWLLGLFVLYSIYLVAQRYTGIDWVRGFSATIPPNRFAYGVYRPNGFVSHPLTLACNLTLLGAYAFLSSFHEKKDRHIRWFWLGIGGLCLFDLVISQSRGPLLMLLLVIASAGVSILWRHRLITAVFAGVFTLFIWWEGGIFNRVKEVVDPSQALETKVERVIFWKVHWAMFADHPMAGVGYPVRKEASLDYYERDGYTNIERKYAAHNIFLQILADSGLIGLFGFLLILISVWVAAKRSEVSQSRIIPYLVIASILVGLLQNTFRDTEFLFCFWLLIALIFSERTVVNESPESLGDRTKEIKDNQHRASAAHFRENVRGEDELFDSHR